MNRYEFLFWSSFLSWVKAVYFILLFYLATREGGVEVYTKLIFFSANDTSVRSVVSESRTRRTKTGDDSKCFDARNNSANVWQTQMSAGNLKVIKAFFDHTWKNIIVQMCFWHEKKRKLLISRHNIFLERPPAPVNWQ